MKTLTNLCKKNKSIFTIEQREKLHSEIDHELAYNGIDKPQKQKICKNNQEYTILLSTSRLPSST
jgi:uncharacterized protein (UPF0333 family)